MADETNVDYVAEMTKKFKKEDGSLDIAALSRGKYEADNSYIPQLERELSELREDLKKRETLEQVVAKIKAMKAEDSNQGNQTPTEPQVHSAPNQTDVTEMVRQTLANERAVAQKQANVNQVNQELTKMWGSGHQTRVNSKAQELGVSVQFLEDMKATHPSAFLKLVADAPQRSPGAYEPPRTQVSNNTPEGSVKNWAYWNKLRKSDPTYYHSIEGARERDRISQVMGDDFFN